ncbi:MAG: aminotransferase class V-fold PLP-dependent enzyme [Acidimicrobiia bacterium]|nr:aminotransferase class V-fold PLP-dependent enzyme [Acidimicrobiia bacterium]
MDLDVAFVRSRFPAFAEPALAGWSFFENAGGSYPCVQTVEALDHYYRTMKVQPYAPYDASARAGEAMDRSRRRWAEALRVSFDDVQFGPSTSMNAYVLAQAFARVVGKGDRVIVTNQDHEANTGAVRRMAAEVGAELVEWRIDPSSGLLDLERLADLLAPATRLVTVPHCSNIVGQENDVAAIGELVHRVGARLVVDGVSFAPHAIPDVAALDADVYLFSLYKTYSVHQGLMVTCNGILDELPNQGHFFNEDQPSKRLTPAGPDHAQEAAAGAVLDYAEELHRHHGGSADDDLATVAASVSRLWQDHETALLGSVLPVLAENRSVRLLGPAEAGVGPLHRCPTVAFVPLDRSPSEVVEGLVARGIMCSAGHFYAYRVLGGLDVDPERGVVRLSWVHYTDEGDIARLIDALRDVLGP